MSYKDIKFIWSISDSYTIDQAAALIAGYDPNSVDASGEWFKDVETGLTCSDGIGDVAAAFTVLVNAISAEPPSLKAQLVFDAEPRFVAGVGNLLQRGYWKGEDVSEVEDSAGDSYVIAKIPNWNKTKIRRDDLITWLSSRNYRPAFFFPDSGDESDPTDQKNPCYAPELADALQAWQAVSTTDGKGKPKARVKAWLDENTSQSNEAKERIATVANWEKGGGATRSS